MKNAVSADEIRWSMRPATMPSERDCATHAELIVDLIGKLRGARGHAEIKHAMYLGALDRIIELEAKLKTAGERIDALVEENRQLRGRGRDRVAA